jgi:hypothetical protein
VTTGRSGSGHKRVQRTLYPLSGTGRIATNDNEFKNIYYNFLFTTILFFVFFLVLFSDFDKINTGMVAVAHAGHASSGTSTVSRPTPAPDDGPVSAHPGKRAPPNAVPAAPRLPGRRSASAPPPTAPGAVPIRPRAADHSDNWTSQSSSSI